MRKLPPLSALRAFEAAARHGSFKRASEELGVTATAVSHQMAALEAHLGVKLFDRKIRKVALTPAGQGLFPVLRAGLDSFAQAISHVSGPEGRRVVTIGATAAFTARWLMPRLAGFQADHPGIDLRIDATENVADLTSGGIDVAVRYGHGPYPGLRAERLMADRFSPVVSPALKISDPAQLLEATLIHFDWHNPGLADPTWPAWLAAAAMPRETGAGHLRFSQESHAIDAVLAGRGVALLSDRLVEGDIAAGRLVAPFGPALPAPSYFIVFADHANSDESVEAVRGWLRQVAHLSA